VKVEAEKHPRALCEVNRLTRNSEKLANAGSRCWKDTFLTLRAKEVSLPYQERTGKKDQETLMKWNQMQK